MIKDTIGKQITDAMKAKDGVRLSTLKMLSAALTNAEIEKMRVKLTEEEELAVVRKEAKKRKDAIEIYKKLQDSKTQKLQAEKNVEREEEELKVLQEFLPKEISDEELTALIDQTIEETGASEMKDMGKVVGKVMAKAGGAIEGSRVASVVKEKLI